MKETIICQLLLMVVLLCQSSGAASIGLMELQPLNEDGNLAQHQLSKRNIYDSLRGMFSNPIQFLATPYVFIAEKTGIVDKLKKM